MARKETLRQAVKLARTGRRPVRAGLDGCPVGGWARTQQALAGLAEELPHYTARHYTVDQLVDALYVVDHVNRYRWREEE